MKNKIIGIEKICIANRALRGNLSLLLLTMFSLCMCFLFIGAYVYQSSKSKYIPYIVTVDGHGVVLTNEVLKQDYKIPKPVVISQLTDYIKCLCSVTKDLAAQRANIYKVYAYVVENSEVFHLISSYYNANNPFELAKKGTKSIEIKNVLFLSSQSVQIDFIEHSIVDNERFSKKMRANISFELEDPATDFQTVMLNPLGIYLSEFHLSEILQDEL